MKIGVFGGTFNPIHFGHLRAAEDARELLKLDKVLFIPSGNHPLKTEGLETPRHRYAMTKIAVSGNPFFEVIDIESAEKKRSYTVNTLERLLTIYHDAELYFMSGIDAFLDIPNWYDPERILSLTNFIIFSRPGNSFRDLVSSPYLSSKKSFFGGLEKGKKRSLNLELKSGMRAVLLQVTPMDISATDIRKRMQQCRSIKYLLPAEIESYIISENLYKFGKQRGLVLRRACL